MAMFLVGADRIQRFGPKDAHDGAEHIGLLVEDINEICEISLDEVDRFAEGGDREPRGQRHSLVEIVLSRHWR